MCDAEIEERTGTPFYFVASLVERFCSENIAFLQFYGTLFETTQSFSFRRIGCWWLRRNAWCPSFNWKNNEISNGDMPVKTGILTFRRWHSIFEARSLLLSRNCSNWTPKNRWLHQNWRAIRTGRRVKKSRQTANGSWTNIQSHFSLLIVAESWFLLLYSEWGWRLRTSWAQPGQKIWSSSNCREQNEILLCQSLALWSLLTHQGL